MSNVWGKFTGFKKLAISKAGEFGQSLIEVIILYLTTL